MKVWLCNDLLNDNTLEVENVQLHLENHYFIYNYLRGCVAIQLKPDASWEQLYKNVDALFGHIETIQSALNRFLNGLNSNIPEFNALISIHENINSNVLLHNESRITNVIQEIEILISTIKTDIITSKKRLDEIESVSKVGEFRQLITELNNYIPKIRGIQISSNDAIVDSDNFPKATLDFNAFARGTFGEGYEKIAIDQLAVRDSFKGYQDKSVVYLPISKLIYIMQVVNIERLKAQNLTKLKEIPIVIDIDADKINKNEFQKRLQVEEGRNRQKNHYDYLAHWGAIPNEREFTIHSLIQAHNYGQRLKWSYRKSVNQYLNNDNNVSRNSYTLEPEAGFKSIKELTGRMNQWGAKNRSRLARKIWIAAGLILEKKYKFYIPGGEIDLVQRHNIADYDRWAQDSLNAIAITQNNLRRSIAQLQGHLQNIDAQLSDLANSFPRENNEAIEISRQRSAVLLPSIYEAESDNSVPVPRENIPESYQSTHIKGNFNALDEIRKLPLSLKVIEYIAGNRPFKIAVQDHNQVQQVTVGCKDIIQVSAAHLASYIRARQSYMYSVVAGLMEEYLMVMATSLPVHLCFIKRNTVDFIHRPKSQYLYFLYAGKCFTEIITCLSLQQFHRLFCQQNKAHLSTQYDIKRLRGDLESLKKEELAIDHPLYGRLSRDVRKRIGKYIKNTASLVEYSLFSMNRIQSSALDHFAMSASSIYLSGDRGISASGELVSGNVMHYTEHEMLTGKMMGFMKTMHLFPLVFRHNTQGAQAFIDGYLNIFRLKSLDIKNGKESQFILKVQKEFLLCKKQMTTLILLVEMRDNYFIEEEVIEYKGICQLMGLIIASLYLYTIDIIDQMVRDKEKVLESYNKRLAEFCIKHSGFTYIKEFDYAVNKSERLANSAIVAWNNIQAKLYNIPVTKVAIGQKKYHEILFNYKTYTDGLLGTRYIEDLKKIQAQCAQVMNSEYILEMFNMTLEVAYNGVGGFEPDQFYFNMCNHIATDMLPSSQKCQQENGEFSNKIEMLYQQIKLFKEEKVSIFLAVFCFHLLGIILIRIMVQKDGDMREKNHIQRRLQRTLAMFIFLCSVIRIMDVNDLIKAQIGEMSMGDKAPIEAVLEFYQNFIHEMEN